MHHRTIVYSLAPALLLLVVSAVHAQSTAARFLLFQPSAVSSSMGGTGVAADGSPFASYFNPAGLAFSPSISATASYEKPLPFFDNVKHSYFAAAVRIDAENAIGASANVYWKGTHPLTTVVPPQIVGIENLTDWHVKLSYARILSDNLAAGVSVGLLHFSLSDAGSNGDNKAARSTSLILDAGVIYRGLFPSTTLLSEDPVQGDFLGDFVDQRSARGFSVGLAVTNIGPKISLIDAERADPLPATFALGFAYSPVQMTPIGVTVAVDAENRLAGATGLQYLHSGTELTLFRLLALRAGYFWDTSAPATSYFTWGAGLRFRFLHLNVARYTRALLPTWQFDGTFSWEIQ